VNKEKSHAISLKIHVHHFNSKFTTMYTSIKNHMKNPHFNNTLFLTIQTLKVKDINYDVTVLNILNQINIVLFIQRIKLFSTLMNLLNILNGLVQLSFLGLSIISFRYMYIKIYHKTSEKYRQSQLYMEIKKYFSHNAWFCTLHSKSPCHCLNPHMDPL
jgi:hypothetical protein